jgi:dethiobiotin synthetase
MNLPQRLVVCGTDTNVGKTLVSAVLVQGLTASYWKPVQCGDLACGGDSGTVQALTGAGSERILAGAYKLKQAASPHQAAAAEGLSLQESQLNLPLVQGSLVVELAGGLLVPLRHDWLQIDMVQSWGLPVVLVARSGLGTLNHSLLSLEALERRRIQVLGLVVNGQAHPENENSLKSIGRVPILGRIPPLERVDASTIKGLWSNSGLSNYWQ